MNNPFQKTFLWLLFSVAITESKFNSIKAWFMQIDLASVVRDGV